MANVNVDQVIMAPPVRYPVPMALMALIVTRHVNVRTEVYVVVMGPVDAQRDILDPTVSSDALRISGEFDVPSSASVKMKPSAIQPLVSVNAVLDGLDNTVTKSVNQGAMDLTAVWIALAITTVPVIASLDAASAVREDMVATVN